MELLPPVVLFRKAILKAKVDGFQFDSLDLFPVNCCEFSSYLLAKFLMEKVGVSPLIIVTGENRFKKSRRHIWIKFGEVDIDITANQFSSTGRAIFVEANSEWHKRFTIINAEKPNLKMTQFNEDTRSALSHDYKKILFLVNSLFTTG